VASIETVTPTHWTARGEVEVPPPDRQKQGRAIQVFGGIPGERADVRITSVGQNRSYGFWIGARSPSPDRVEPPCDRFGPCGGCPLMHLRPEAQYAVRRQNVRDALADEGLKDVAVGAFHACPDGDAGFRHVVKLGFGMSDRNRLKVGAWARNTRHVVPIPNCHVAAPVLRRVMASLAHHAIELDLWPWDPDTDRGVLRAAVLRASRSTGKVMITLVVGRRTKRLDELAELVATNVGEVVGVWAHVNTDTGNSIFLRDADGVIGVQPLVGTDDLEETLLDVRYSMGPGDFFQTNPAVAEIVYKRTIERLELVKDVPVIDLYSGVGGFALQAAKVTGWALGVEEIDGAVARARSAARRNGIEGAEFVSDRVDLALPDIKRRLGDSHPVLTVNPARRGLEPGVVEGILGLEPRRIAYVSCNATAMARDVRAFVEAGYRVNGEVELFDMFPHTAHQEALIVLDAPAGSAEGKRAPRRKVVR